MTRTLSYQETWRKNSQGNCLIISSNGHLETLVRKVSHQETQDGCWSLAAWVCHSSLWSVAEQSVGPNTNSQLVLRWLPCWHHLSWFILDHWEIFPHFLMMKTSAYFLVEILDHALINLLRILACGTCYPTLTLSFFSRLWNIKEMKIPNKCS